MYRIFLHTPIHSPIHALATPCRYPLHTQAYFKRYFLGNLVVFCAETLRIVPDGVSAEADFKVYFYSVLYLYRYYNHTCSILVVKHCPRRRVQGMQSKDQ